MMPNVARFVSGWLLACLVVLLVGGGAAAADPTSPSAPPSSSSAPTSNPPAPTTAPGDTSAEIPAGTPKQGTIHWEQFGSGQDDAPQDLQSFSNTIIGYALTAFGAAAVISTLCIFMMMIVGFRGRSQVAKLAAEQSVWVWVAVMIVGSFSTLGGLLVAGGLG